MRFLAPQFLPVLWLLLLPVVLYLFRPQSRRVPVSTLLFFKALAREHQDSAWLRRLKKLLSLLLSLAVLGGAGLALARLTRAPAPGDVKSVVIAIDRSASMGAVNAAGQTRLDDARTQLRTRLAALAESIPVALVAFDARTEIVEPLSTDRRALLRSLDSLAIRPMADNAGAAHSLADRMAAQDTPAEIWWVSDRPPPATPRDGVRIVPLPVGLANPPPVNAGITAFDLRRLPLTHARYQAYVQIGLNPAAPRTTTVTVEPQVGGLPLARRQVDVPPGALTGLTLEIDAAPDQVLTVTATTPGDVLAEDNRVAARLPDPKPLIVARFAEKPDPFADLALQSLAADGEIEIFTGSPAQWPPQNTPDVLVFDGWLPPDWKADRPAVFLNPPRSVAELDVVRLQQPIPRDAIRVLDDQHPILFRVPAGRVALSQTAVLGPRGAWQTLWVAGEQSLLAAGEIGGHRMVALAAAPSLSEQLPLTATWPVLLGNALLWIGEKADASRAPRLLHTGAVIDTHRQPLEWREWTTTGLSTPRLSPAAPTDLAELTHSGLWRLADGSESGSALLASAHETALSHDPGSADPGQSPAPAAAPAPSPTTSWLRGDLALWLLATVILFLLLESWLFHRHAVS